MLALFCLRLATGLIAALALFSPKQVNPRFFRAHFLIVLALGAGAAILLRDHLGDWLGLVLAAAIVSAFVGSVVWSLERAPGAGTVAVLTFLSLAAALGRAGWILAPSLPLTATLAGEYSSALLLGTVTTAMLMGHSYLVAPGMSISPLRNLLAGMGAATFVRMAVAGLALVSWTAQHSLVNLKDETVIWLPLRWGLGFAGPLVLGWMAWQSAKIRSTQSATGILYVAVIFCFLGELTSLLLLESTGLDL